MSIREFCDRCGQETTLAPSKYRLRHRAESNRLDLGTPMFLQEKDIELCSACNEVFLHLLQNSKKDDR